MIVKENPISSQYHQVYFTFSIGTVNNIFDSVIKKRGFTKKELEKNNNLITKLVLEEIEDVIIEEELEKLERIPLSSRKYRYLTEIKRDKPLLVICQFCILSSGIQIRFPAFINLEHLDIPYINEVLQDFTDNLLIQHEEYDEVEFEKATKDSIVTYDLNYVQDSFVLSEVKDMTINLNLNEAESMLFLNCKKDDIINLDESDSVKVIAKVTKIHKKVVKKLSDELVEKIGFLETKTVDEFNERITNIFKFSTYSIALINYLTEFVLKTKDVKFDEYVIAHFLDNELAPKKKNEVDAYLKEVQRELVKEYIITIINLNYVDVAPRFLSNILEEYEFDKILFKNPIRLNSYQEYVNRRIFETRVLEYCIDNNIVKFD